MSVIKTNKIRNVIENRKMPERGVISFDVPVG
jgi:hypothetical protein